MIQQPNLFCRFAPLAGWGLVVACAVIALPGGAVAAEDLTPPKSARSEELPPPLHGPGEQPTIHTTDDLESQIRRLITEVKESRERVRESQETVPSPGLLDQPKKTVNHAEVFQEIDEAIDEWDQNRDDRITEIQDKVRLLNRLLASKKIADEIKAIEKPARPAPANNAIDAPPVAPATEPGEVNSQEAGPATEAAVTPTPITDSAVDQLSLADNLFGADNIPLALGAYQSVDQSKLTNNEKAWVTYQFGVCHRRLGKLTEAQKHFRIVAGMNAADGLPLFARWQLDAMGRKTDLTSRIVNVKAVIESTQAQIQSLSANEE